VPPPPPPPAPKPLPPLARALIAEVDADAAKGAAEILALWRIEAEVVDDGGEALVRMFRTPPALAILGVELPSLRASRIAEVCQRASELAAVKLVRIASSSDQSGTAGFDSEEMLEAGDYPAGLPEILGRLGIGAKPTASPVAPAPRAPAPRAAANAPAATAKAADRRCRPPGPRPRRACRLRSARRRRRWRRLPRLRARRPPPPRSGPLRLLSCRAIPRSPRPNALRASPSPT
jgi:CheY-like chemotaxis protein